MKKILLALVLMFSLSSFGQTINEIPIKDLDVQYLQIVGTSKMLSSKLTIAIDIGQRTKLFSSNTDTTLLKDENGEGLIFNSMIDALNFMSANGYDFVTANILTVGGQNVYHYLMRKKI
ncbi:hypothetical protein IR010_19050 [Flavobacterium sp. MR2016-29]|uniref:hypothetical protein n=1 Tax=Flavobacterium sp. MR2016-29 TaxID=2783795 RepID=UPI00188A76CC|nr:hypothetical protein [Flavobacterium sp. MR2016-29]MBF4494645.1 hypothetical protein [Flavobacterium sp. MR2016-29]